MLLCSVLVLEALLLRHQQTTVTASSTVLHNKRLPDAQQLLQLPINSSSSRAATAKTALKQCPRNQALNDQLLPTEKLQDASVAEIAAPGP